MDEDRNIWANMDEDRNFLDGHGQRFFKKMMNIEEGRQILDEYG